MTHLTTLTRSWFGATRLNFRKQIASARGKKVVHFLHIGKTGGSALKTVFAAYPETWGCLLLRNPHSVRLKDIPVGEKVVFITRDPLRRFVSGFNSRLRQGAPRNCLPWSAGEKVAFEEFPTPNELAIALSSPDERRRQNAETAMRTISHVRSSMWDWFGDEAYFRSRLDDILFVGRQESLSDDFEELKKVLKLPAQVSLPSDGVTAHRTPDNFDKKLSGEAVVNLTRWFVKEYQFLDLCSRLLSPEVAPSHARANQEDEPVSAATPFGAVALAGAA